MVCSHQEDRGEMDWDERQHLDLQATENSFSRHCCGFSPQQQKTKRQPLDVITSFQNKLRQGEENPWHAGKWCGLAKLKGGKSTFNSQPDRGGKKHIMWGENTFDWSTVSPPDSQQPCAVVPLVGVAPWGPPEQTVCDDYRPPGGARGCSLIDCHERP